MRQKGEGQSEREMRKQGDRVTARYREGQSARARDRERESDSQHFKSLRRGVLRAFWDLKAENGVLFFRTEVFLDSTFSFFS